MRIAGIVLVFIGLVAAVVGMASGCGALFTWNGRHAVYAKPLSEGRSTQALEAVGGKRYTIGIQVVFDRAGLETREDGVIAVESEMPLVVRVRDAASTTLAETSGWLDPNKPPNVLYGQAARESIRGPIPELAVERLVGPFTAASDAPLNVEVDLGADRIGTARVLERRLVVFDDSLPPGIRNAFILSVVGTLAFIGGSVLIVVGWFKRRRKPRQGPSI